MTEADLLALLIIFLCLLGSMFFSGSETAISSFGELRAKRILEEGGPKARYLRDWVERPVQVLSTILVGNNLVNTLMGAMATALAIRKLGTGPYSDWAVPVAVLVTTGLLLIFGEITPKAVGRMYTRQVTVPVLRILAVMHRMFLPVVWLSTRLTDSLIAQVFDDESNRSSGSPITTEEIGYLVEVGEREGSIPEDQAELLGRIVLFDEKIVADIAVPQSEMTHVDLSWDLERIKEAAIRSGHSRIPVSDRDVDNIKGVLHIKELVGVDDPDGDTVASLMRRPLFVSDSLLIHDLLTRFKEKRSHLAIVVDDGGHTVGIVTLEDVIEQIVGEIYDETDRDPKRSVDAMGVRYMDGTSALAVVEEQYDTEFEEIGGVTSVGDLLCHMAGQVPIAGSVFVLEGLRFKVLAADDRHIIRVSVEQLEIEDEEDDY